MAVFDFCSWPIWQADDFTQCFHQNYLGTLSPLLVVGLSFLTLFWVNIGRIIPNQTSSKYEPLATDASTTAFTDPSRNLDDCESTVHEDTEYDDAMTSGSFFGDDTHSGYAVSGILEAAVVATLLAIRGIVMATTVYQASNNLATLSGLVTWAYTLSLVIFRILMRQSEHAPNTWTHSVVIYICNWFLALIAFRSAVILSTWNQVAYTSILDFCLTTVLFVLALTSASGTTPDALKWENGIPPSREPLANLFSKIYFVWVDGIIWQGWKQNLAIGSIWNVIPEDKAAHVLRRFRNVSQLHSASLTRQIFLFFRSDLFRQCLFGGIAGLFTFAPTLLIKGILEYVEQPDGRPRSFIWLLVILLPVSDIVRAIAENQNLWIGRKVCIRVRAIVIGEIYAKSLRRRVNSGAPAAQESRDDEAGERRSAQDAGQASNGTIINLMSVDTFKIAELTAYLPGMISSGPIQLILAVTLLWHIMGASAAPGLIMMVLLLPMQFAIANAFNYALSKVMAAADVRIDITSEVLQNIRLIKLFAWQKRFGIVIDEKRETELGTLWTRYALFAAAAAIHNAIPGIVTFFSFLIYTIVEGKPLLPSVAFTAMSLFTLLRMPLDLFGEIFSHIQESLVSLHRVNKFLNEEETQKYNQLGLAAYNDYNIRSIGFRNATLAWTTNDPTTFQLINLNVDFQIGKLNIVAGRTGSGKTSMIMGLLGEMACLGGEIFCAGARGREEVQVNQHTNLAETVAYVAQSAWLMNATIKANITFASPFDPKRYREVVRVCALERDLEILDESDETLVGEKGIALSGGQKQRISIARAVYSNSAYVLMDDCLSAVDAHTAHWIYHQCILGPLMVGRTCILATHNIQLCVPQSDYVVVLENGRVCVQGPPTEVIESGKLGQSVQQQLAAPKISNYSFGSLSGFPPDVDGMIDPDAGEQTERNATNPMAETMTKGAVRWDVMKLYMSSMGSKWFWTIAILLFILQQLAPMALYFWVREWANEYANQSKESSNTADPGPQRNRAYFTLALPNWDEKNHYYIIGVGILGLCGPLLLLLRDGWMYRGSLVASRLLHTRLMNSVMGAKFQFFDTTPLGGLMNRFTKDLETIDQETTSSVTSFANSALSMVITLVLISCITPGFLLPAFFVLVAAYFLAIFYLGASRDLKRIESVQRTPIFQQFRETLSGIVTIRAYGDQARFIRDNLDKINTANRPFIYLWACNRWIALRADFLCQFVTFFAGVFVILQLGKVDAGAAGISLSYAMTFMESVLWFIKKYGSIEQNLNSMERVKEYLDVDQEAASLVAKNRTPSTWPDKGGVEFVNYTTRYRTNLEPVLRSISVKIAPREKVGIVGRTGAGKSSMILALFRALEAETGKIIVDGIDISKIGMQDLREKIAIVPQDAALLVGTVRSNVDPFGEFTDTQVLCALRRVHLISEEEIVAPLASGEAARQEVGVSDNVNRNIFLDLSSPITESGGNLSQGQRQLVCLARAMIKEPKLLVMDEATASVDYATDSKIQETIRDVKGTVITVAHRLQTIADYDKVAVLDKGEVVEFASPWELIQDQDSQFYSMCASSGNLDVLAKAAKEKWEKQNLD